MYLLPFINTSSANLGGGGRAKKTKTVVEFMK